MSLPRLKPHARLLLVLMCVLALGLRISGAHVHLCLDGSEPPAALHIQSDVDHHPTDETHDDVDVNLAGHPLLKKADFDQELSAPLSTTFLMYHLPQTTVASEFPEPISPAILAARHLRPPLRGPPVQVSPI